MTNSAPLTTETRQAAQQQPNPYQPPVQDEPPAPPLSEVPLPDSVVTHLASIRPWTRACAIVGFLLSAGILLAAFSFGVAAYGLYSLSQASPGLGASSPPPWSLFGVLTVISLTVAALSMTTSYRLWAFGSSIDQLCESMDSADLEVTSFLQHRFWRSAGITAFVLIVWLILILVSALLR